VLHQINYSHESVYVDRDCGFLDVQISHHYINVHIIYDETDQHNVPDMYSSRYI
jgi:hypothetical protein